MKIYDREISGYSEFGYSEFGYLQFAKINHGQKCLIYQLVKIKLGINNSRKTIERFGILYLEQRKYDQTFGTHLFVKMKPTKIWNSAIGENIFLETIGILSILTFFRKGVILENTLVIIGGKHDFSLCFGIKRHRLTFNTDLVIVCICI